MVHIKFSLDLNGQTDSLIKIVTDYENIHDYLPDQVSSVKVIKQNDKEVITEELLKLSSISLKIKQKSLHKKISDNKLCTEIVLGPVKGTIINIMFEKKDSGTIVYIDIYLKLGFKFKFLQPLIKKYYKMFMAGTLYRINTGALQLQKN